MLANRRVWIGTAAFLASMWVGTQAPVRAQGEPAGPVLAKPDQAVVAEWMKECRPFCEVAFGAEEPCDAFCADVARDQSAMLLGLYISAAQSANKVFLEYGPKVAKDLVEACMGAAATSKPDLGALAFCITMKKGGLDVEAMAQGKGPAPKYAALVRNVVETPATPYPLEDTAEAEAARASMREAAVYGCVEQAKGFAQTLCSAVAVHEVFADRPFGGNGDLAKAFDKVAQLYSYVALADLPQALVRQKAKEVLKQVGVDEKTAEIITNPEAAVVGGGIHAVNQVKQGTEHAKGEANKQLEKAGIPLRF